jgi:hypothetical protein
MIVQFVLLLWHSFIYVKILEWNVSKCAYRLYINAPMVPYSCEHLIHIHTWQLLPFFLAATRSKMQVLKINYLKGLSHEIDFKNVVENGQILALIRAAAGFLIFRRLL